MGTDPVHLPASAFCCFSIFSRRPSKESILVLICVSSFLIVCNSSDFTGGGKGTESNRKSKARTHGYPVLPPDAVKSQRMLSSPINSDCLQLPQTPRTGSHSDSPGWEPDMSSYQRGVRWRDLEIFYKIADTKFSFGKY